MSSSKWRLIIGAGLLSLLVWVGLLYAAPTPQAEVSFVEGKALAQKGANGAWTPLARGSKLAADYTIKTEKGAKIELKLPDGSIIRLSPGSRVALKSLMAQGAKDESKASFKLSAGKLWANVSKVVGNERKFEVTTGNAVAGVRGTVFRVDALEEQATVVRVYSGSVAVIGNRLTPAKSGARTEVPGPKEVTKKEFEEIVAAAMQEVRVAEDGILKMAAFSAESEAGDTWVAWNQERDAQSGIEHSAEPTP